MGEFVLKYLILHRAIKNFGDFLIYERGKELVRELKGDYEIIVGKAFEPLEKQFTENELSNVDAVIIPGGPGVVGHMYPNVYPSLKLVLDMKKPLFFLGMGAKLHPSNVRKGALTVEFTESSLKVLMYTKEFAPIGVRDYITKKVLQDVGIVAQMNGCPAWYDMNYAKKPFNPPKRLKKIALSVPALPIYVNQFIDLVKALHQTFPEVNIIISFNRGISQENSTKAEYEQNLYIASEARKLGVEIIDLAYSTEKARIYDECDIHIGYRVHSHIYFLSHRKPSILIAEDSRGIGVGKALSTPYIRGWEPISGLDWFKEKVLRKLKIRRVWEHFSTEISSRVLQLVNEEIENEFIRFSHVGSLIDAHFERFMKPYIENYIP